MTKDVFNRAFYRLFISYIKKKTLQSNSVNCFGGAAEAYAITVLEVSGTITGSDQMYI